MLEVQEYLIAFGLDALVNNFAIKVKLHPYLPLMILNYHQTDSTPKWHPIVKECRGLVLADDFRLVARSFPRFFNWGEMADEQPLINFDRCCAHEKIDGSLVLLFYYSGIDKWMCTTRGSFADEPMQFQNFTWEEGICEALGVANLQELPLDRDLTYVCEFVSPWNKVVHTYLTPALYLLTAFRGEYELSSTACDWLVADRWMRRTARFDFNSIAEVQAYIEQVAITDPTYEGVVLRDCDNRRWKVKNPKYLALHRLKGEGDNMYNPKNLLPFILDGEESELLTYFSEASEAFYSAKTKVDDAYKQLLLVWEECYDIPVQKDFALAIKDRTPFTGLLFKARNDVSLGFDPNAVLPKLWRNSAPQILKVLFKDKDGT